MHHHWSMAKVLSNNSSQYETVSSTQYYDSVDKH